MRDLDSIFDVWTLARDVADGNARRAMMLSVAETRAIAQLASGAAEIVNLACLVVEASDARAPKAELKRRLEALCNATRTITRGINT
jgi:hypothetical protein